MATKNKTFTQYLFEVTGGFDIDDDLEPILDASGNICGFTLPDGREADIAICMRVEGGDKEEWITSERKMAQLGFESLDYGKSDFIPLIAHT